MHDGAAHRFLSFLVLERARHVKRWRFAAVLAALIAILLYETQWPILRPGLTILLVGQAGVAVSLVLRNSKISKELCIRNAGDTIEAPFSSWFEGEEVFLKRLAIFESACQTIGFVTLGLEIWVSTGSLLLSLLIGLIYPVTAYFGMLHRRNIQTIRRLTAEKRKVSTE